MGPGLVIIAGAIFVLPALVTHPGRRLSRFDPVAWWLSPEQAMAISRSFGLYGEDSTGTSAYVNSVGGIESKRGEAD